MIHRNKTKILLCVILISVVFIFWRWFFDLSILSAGDWGFFYGEFQKTFLTFPYLWVGNLSFGGVDISLSMYPAVFLFGILSHFVNFAFAERILYFWPVVFISILGSFFLVKKITGSDAASITGSIVFLCNTYFLTLGTGHLTVMMGVALAPLILLFFIKTLEQKKMITAIITGFLCFAASFYEFRIFYLILWILFFYFLFYCFIIDKVNFKKFLINAFWASIPVILSVLLNFYWIFGFYTLNIAADTRVFNRGLFGNSYMNLLRSISLFHPFWTGAKLSSFVVQQIPVHFGLVPLFAFLGFLLNRKNKFVLFFGVLSLLGIFFSKQVAEPFPALYFWFYNNLPGFNAFREASKFYFFISLGYAVLIGAFVFWLWNKISGWKKWKFTRYLLIFLIAFTFLWNAKPVIIGNLGKLFISRSIPADYIILKDDILRQSSDYFRMMWMPVYSRWSYYDSEHPKISLANLCMGDWKDFVDFKSIDYSWPMQDRIIKVLNLPFSNNLLDQSSIKYIIVPIRDLENDDDFFASYGGNRDFFITELDKIKFLERLEIGTKELVVYENSDTRPHIYTTSIPETIYQYVPFNLIKFTYQNSTRYKIQLSSVSTSTYINFSESYHPDWKLRIAQFSWIDALFDDKYFISDDFHVKTNAGFNSFLIDLEYIKQNYPPSAYKLNPDGSIDLELTLYFKPQSYFYLGSIISGITLLGCLFYLAGYIIRWLKQRNNGSSPSIHLS